MGRTSNNAGAQSPATPADAVEPESEVISSHEGAVADVAIGSESPPADIADESEMEDPTPTPDEKVKVKHEILKGKQLTLPSGEIAAFDENGILETDKETAEYLLSIPGYEKG
jgi:hypothetical protein